MKSATVMGPRSRIRCRTSSRALRLVLRDGEERLLAAPEDQHKGRAARLDFRQLAAGFRRARHALAIDARDHVAWSNPGACRRTLRLDVDDHRALRIPVEAQPPRHL